MSAEDGRGGIAGHARVRERLAAAVREGTLSQATLLTGPEGVGKTTVALEVATGLLDTASWPGPPATHPDLWLEDGPGERIGIGRLRSSGGEAGDQSLQDFLSLRSYSGGPRVAVLARADRLTLEAANCMLRTVEEPAPAAHLLLCCAHPDRLPATLISRCRCLALGPVDRAEIDSWLRRRGLGAEAAEMAALLAGGRPGRALRLASDPEALGLERRALEGFLEAAGGGEERAVTAADALAPPAGAEGRERSLVQLSVWADFLRDAACHAGGAPELASWRLYATDVERWSSLPGWRLAAMLARCGGAADQLERNANPRLCYESLFLDIFAGDPAPPPRSPAVQGAAIPE